MAVSANTVWEVRASGAFNNGGGFVTGASGTDFSQQDSAQYALTGLISSGASAVIPTASAAADMVGNLAHVISGTNATAGFYEILSVNVGVDITVDRNWCTGVVASGVVNIGGATNLNSASITQMTSAAVAGNTVWIKSGAYTAGNQLTFSSGTAALPMRFLGYTSARGDACNGANRPSIDMAANYFQTGNNNLIANIQLTANASSSRALAVTQNACAVNCKITCNTSTSTNRAILPSNISAVIGCEIICPNAIGIEQAGNNCLIDGCYFNGCLKGVTNSFTSQTMTITNCIFNGCGTAIEMTGVYIGQALVSRNTFYGGSSPTGVGLSITNASANAACISVIGNIFSNLTTGITHASGSNTNGNSDYNVFYGNTTARTNWPTGLYELTSNPSFVNPSGGDFSVGTNAKALGFPRTYGSNTTNYIDVGAAQREEDYPAASSVISGVSYSNGELTGTYTAPSAADIADAVWDEALSGHTTAGSFGAQVGGKLLTVAKFLGLK